MRSVVRIVHRSVVMSAARLWESPPAPASQIVPKAGRPTVLLADPDASFRGELAVALSERFEIYHAADGATALRLATTLMPSLVIAELDLPLLDGFTLARLIKSKTSQTRNVPVVFLSARSAPREVALAIAAGARRFLPKPCTPEAMLDVATRIVGG